MRERWRKPARVLDVQPLEQGIWVPGSARVFGGVQVTLDADTIDRMRAGYLCAKCLEPFEQAWPERCPVCGAPIRTEQAEYFAREFAGEENLPTFDEDDEIARMHEQIEREERDGA